VPRVLLIALPGFDWRFAASAAERGDLPHLSALVAGGVIADVPRSEPAGVPAAVWTSVAVGVGAEAHGVFGDWFVAMSGALHSTEPASRRVPAIWNWIAANGGRADVINWPGCTVPEMTNGLYLASSGPGFSPNAATAVALPRNLEDRFPSDAVCSGGDSLWIKPEDIDDDVLALFPPAASPRIAARTIGALRVLLARCFTVHNFATLAVDVDGASLCAVCYPVLAQICGIFPPTAPVDPWSDVSSALMGAYRLIDILLGRLLDLAGVETTTILAADHGYGARGPGGPPLPDGRGFIALAGPEMRRDERIYKATLLDVAPTVLNVLGIPVPAAMAGRVLAGAFAEQPRPETPIGAAPAAVVPAHTQIGGNAGESSYVLLDGQAEDNVRQDLRWNHARALIAAGRVDVALPILWNLYQGRPIWGKVAISLADGLCVVGMPVLASQFLRVVPDAWGDPVYHYQLGVAAKDCGRTDEAVAHLRTAEDIAAASESDQAKTPVSAQPASFYTRIAFVYVRARRISDARRLYERASVLYPNDPTAWLGRAACAMFEFCMEDAVRFARHSISLQHDLTLPHLVLARSLYALRRVDEAFQACETALTLSSQLDEVHSIMARLYAARPDGASAAARHRAAARSIREHRAGSAVERAERRHAVMKTMAMLGIGTRDAGDRVPTPVQLS
jgi:tetratricopeptide (TPR) repeat protein